MVFPNVILQVLIQSLAGGASFAAGRIKRLSHLEAGKIGIGRGEKNKQGSESGNGKKIWGRKKKEEGKSRNKR